MPLVVYEAVHIVFLRKARKYLILVLPHPFLKAGCDSTIKHSPILVRQYVCKATLCHCAWVSGKAGTTQRTSRVFVKDHRRTYGPGDDGIGQQLNRERYGI